MINTYIVKRDNKLLCGNCRMHLPHLTYTCPFCGGGFSNYQTVLNELFYDFKVGHLTSNEIYDIIITENKEEE